MEIASLNDPVALTQALIRRPSVTPADAGAMDIVEGALTELGFTCRRMRFGQIENLYARIGEARPNLCFAGHTDVVPVGDAAAWSRGPFDGDLADGIVHGRGAVDMKSAVAAFICAAAGALSRGKPKGSISLLITGDEEGVAEHGTKAVVAALIQEGETIDHCLVGEPTSYAVFGDMIKNGRRGSISAKITVHGVQGHVAYPHRAANPVPVLIRLLAALQARVLDEGYPGFPRSNLEVTTVDVGNTAGNVIPARATAALNIRFNPAHTGATLGAWLDDAARSAAEGFGGRVELTSAIGGEAFVTPPGAFTALVSSAVRAVTGVEPELSTTGGTSDARFIRAMCEVVEFGLVGASMHAVDESAPTAQIQALAAVYERVIDEYFAASSP
ncbi:MAG TPA: succinyl-diaminopimelate desuccinylase [Caulobacteraceae bacterium]